MKVKIVLSTIQLYALDNDPPYWGRGDSGLEEGVINGVGLLADGTEPDFAWSSGCYFAHIMGDRDEV